MWCTGHNCGTAEFMSCLIIRVLNVLMLKENITLKLLELNMQLLYINEDK